MPTSPEPQRPSAEGTRLYDLALSEAERLHFDTALLVQGFDDEIALLRVCLRRFLAEHPDGGLQALLPAVTLLVRAAAVKHRLSPAASEDLAQGFASVISQVGDILRPEDARE